MIVDWWIFIFFVLISLIIICAFIMIGMLICSNFNKESDVRDGFIIGILFIVSLGLSTYLLLSNSFYTQDSKTFSIEKMPQVADIQNRGQRITFNEIISEGNSKSVSYPYGGNIEYHKLSEGKSYIECKTKTYLFHDDFSQLEDIHIYYME